MRSIIIAVLLAVTVSAQQPATTADGKRVTLNPDGTWKYAEGSTGATLRIEAGLIYRSGDVRPVARTPFTLLAAEARDELMKLPLEGKYNFTGVEQLKGTCEQDHPAAMAIVRKHIRYSLMTGFDGKAELRDIAPGKYWLFGRTLTRDRCITWFMELDLTKDQNIALDQNNAI